MVTLQEREQRFLEDAARLQDAIDTIQQPRTDFEITHYVVGQHALPGKQWAQVVLELQIRMFNIRRAQLNESRILAEIEILRAKNNTPMDAIDAQLKEIDLQELQLARLGAVREAEVLYGIFMHMKSYTREQIEAEEPEYWRTRLSEQVRFDGNLAAVRQMLTQPGDRRTAPLTTEHLENLALMGEAGKLLAEPEPEHDHHRHKRGHAG